jgi:Asp-tRNA(Asn)/Glu-tRNA(Gln) amidotransferase B subunit
MDTNIQMTSENDYAKNIQIVAKKAVEFVLGKDNDYVERLLIDRLCGHNKDYTYTPITELIPPQKRDELKKELSADVEISQKKAITKLNKTLPPSQHVIVDIGGMLPKQEGLDNATIDVSDDQSVSSWIVNTLLQEKLNYREVQESAERKKTFNGTLAVILPIITPIIVSLIQHYFFETGSSSC